METREHFWKEFLLYIFDEQGRATHEDMQKHFGKGAAQVSGCLYNLKCKGLIIKTGFRKYGISEKGKETLVEIFPAMATRMFGGDEKPEEPKVADSLPLETVEEEPKEPIVSTDFWQNKFIELAFKLAEKR